jgi:phosphoglycerate-specific signal transduction histidine kinase
VWNSLEPEDVNLKLCPDCQNEQKIIDELSNAGLRIRYLETLYDTDRNIMIFKNHKKQNISIHILSNFCYTIFNSNNNHPMTVATVDEIINYLGQPNL